MDEWKPLFTILVGNVYLTLWGGAAVPGSGTSDTDADTQRTADVYKEGISAAGRLDTAMSKAGVGVKQLEGIVSSLVGWCWLKPAFVYMEKDIISYSVSDSTPYVCCSVILSRAPLLTAPGFSA